MQGKAIKVVGVKDALQGTWLLARVPVNNAAGSVWASVTVKGCTVGTLSDHVETLLSSGASHWFVRKAQGDLAYDDDGNLTQDGRWTYAWDEENRLSGMETVRAAVTAGAPKWKLVFKFDAFNRRIEKRVRDWNARTSAYVTKLDEKSVYDGWNLLATLVGSGVRLPNSSFELD